MSAPLAEADLLAASQTVITALAGPEATVRPDQLDAVRALVVERRRALVVQATGWGKSAVYWIAARAVRDAGGGPGARGVAAAGAHGRPGRRRRSRRVCGRRR